MTWTDTELIRKMRADEERRRQKQKIDEQTLEAAFPYVAACTLFQEHHRTAIVARAKKAKHPAPDRTSSLNLSRFLARHAGHTGCEQKGPTELLSLLDLEERRRAQQAP